MTYGEKFKEVFGYYPDLNVNISRIFARKIMRKGIQVMNNANDRRRNLQIF